MIRKKKTTPILQILLYSLIIVSILSGICDASEEVKLKGKIGIGKDVFSYYSYPGVFLKFQFNDLYSLKTGGFVKYASYSPTSLDFRFSIINGFNIKRFKNFIIFCDLDTYYTLDYSTKYSTYEFQSFGAGVNLGFDFYINKYISLGYKLGCYANFMYSRVDKNIKADVGFANITTALLNSFSIYMYFK